MPESIATLREARQVLKGMAEEDAERELKSFRLSPQERLFLFFGDDYVGFAKECFRWGEDEEMTPYQEDYLGAIPVEKKVSVRGPHGLGKTAAISWLVWGFSLTRDGLVDWKIVTTAGGQRQLEKYLWPEIHKWSRRLKWDVIGRKPFNPKTELMTLTLRLSTGEAFAAASDNPELIEGAHAKHLLYILDESKLVPGATFDAMEGAFANQGIKGYEAYALSSSTPGEPVGRFADIQLHRPGYEDWWVRPVKLWEVIKAGRIGKEWADQRGRQWGVESAIYKNKVGGDFASSDSASVIPAEWVALAQERWLDLYEIERHTENGIIPTWIGDDLEPDLEAVGGDLAYGGEDDTVFAPRHGDFIPNLHIYPYTKDTHKNARRIEHILKTRNVDATAIVDIVGWGAGTYDNLRTWGYETVGFHPQHKTYRRDSTGELGFKDKRSAAWWNMREALDPSSGREVALPPDDGMMGDLIAPTWRSMTGKIEVEPKDKIKERIGRSPDRGDAVVMAYWDEQTFEPRPPRAISVGARKRGKGKKRRGKRIL